MIKRAFAITLLFAAAAPAATYYVSPTGDDDHDGRTQTTAWRSTAKVNAAKLMPGDSVLFARGGEWHEKLTAPASGAASRPIVFDAYGSGAKPKFIGSDPIAAADFQHVDGSPGVYRVAEKTPVTCVFANHKFLRSTAFTLGSNGNPNDDPAANLDKLKSTPNSWFMCADGYLYVHTSSDPRTDHVLYTATTRDDEVYSNSKDHLIFRNLEADETAAGGMGYGMRVMGSTDVRLEHCDVYRAGKHHFGCINSINFVGLGLYAAEGMDELGYGQATAYVSYSDDNQHGNTSTYIDCIVEHYPGQLGAFYSHGAGLEKIELRHMISRGNWIAVGTDNPKEIIEINHCVIENGRLDLYGNHITVDGLTMTGGGDGSLNIGGNDDLVQNCVIAGAGQSTIHDSGQRNKILFNTLVLKGDDPGIHLDAKATDAVIRGNIVAGTNRPIVIDGGGPFKADHNVYIGTPKFTLNGSEVSLTDWLPHDIGSKAVADLGFRNASAGDFSLKSNSPAIRFVPAAAGNARTDHEGKRRSGSAVDAGAFTHGE